MEAGFHPVVPWQLSQAVEKPVARWSITVDRLGLAAADRSTSHPGAMIADLVRFVTRFKRCCRQIKPDIVHITNSMFLGLSEPLKRELGVPVLCSLQGEDIFLDDLAEPFKTRVHEELQAHARAVDGLVTNFPLPRSTLLAMVSSLLGPDESGVDRLRELYAVAVEHKYRFFSYGDAMLILP